MRTLFTIGYEGATLGDFVATLKERSVRRLLDIRDVPISRKKGFSKTALASFLEQNGIFYSHIRELGNPKEGREAARQGDVKACFEIYRSHLEGEAAQDALAKVVSVSDAENSVLLCFERDHTLCHRLIVADEIKKISSCYIEHLSVQPVSFVRNVNKKGVKQKSYAFG